MFFYIWFRTSHLQFSKNISVNIYLERCEISLRNSRFASRFLENCESKFPLFLKFANHQFLMIIIFFLPNGLICFARYFTVTTSCTFQKGCFGNPVSKVYCIVCTCLTKKKYSQIWIAKIIQLWWEKYLSKRSLIKHTYSWRDKPIVLWKLNRQAKRFLGTPILRLNFQIIQWCFVFTFPF